ncbi:MAG: hypothetical protein L6R42_004917 [Xanthoria sp. 1 TBL-2021]|nr:MAG: hypothetical protein L6R42_004917 [Xanthoria sp. 1 TBL-2021]
MVSTPRLPWLSLRSSVLTKDIWVDRLAKRQLSTLEEHRRSASRNSITPSEISFVHDDEALRAVQDAATLQAAKDAAALQAAKDTSASLIAKDASASLTARNNSTSFTANHISASLTAKDASAILTANDTSASQADPGKLAAVNVPIVAQASANLVRKYQSLQDLLVDPTLQ